MSLDQVKQVAAGMLDDVVRLEEDSPDFEILDWEVTRLSDKGLMNPEGLLLFQGQGQDKRGQRPWSVVLKLLMEKNDSPPDNRWYWKREYHAAESGLLAGLPGPVRAPKIFGLRETGEAAWIWMEHLREASSEPWSLDDYAFAARQLGRWNGRYLAGLPLPRYGWLARDVWAGWSGPEDPAAAWQNPEARQWLSEDDIARHIRLCQAQDAITETLHRLPQTFAHQDCMRRNLFVCLDSRGQRELVAADWALCGISALGSELCPLIYGSAFLGDFPFQEIAQLEAACFPAYLRGLREAGWDGPDAPVRLGCLAFLSLLWTVRLPGWLVWFNAPEQRDTIQPGTDQTGGEIAREIGTTLPVLLDRSDEVLRQAG
jgi:hypothetical protein